MSVKSLNQIAANPAKEGYLTKQGGLVKSWRRRWFVLNENKLYYYDSDKKKELLGTIDLEHAEITINNNMGRGREHCIEIKGATKRRYFVLADTAEELESWLNALLKASMWQPDQDVIEEPHEAPSVLEEISLNLSLKGMLGSCCKEEVQHVLNSIDNVKSSIDTENDVVHLEGRMDKQKVISLLEGAGFFVYEI